MGRRTAIISLLLLGLCCQAQVKLVTIEVPYVDFDGNEQVGHMVCNASIEKDLNEIFAELFRLRYPLERIVPMAEYDNDDERSMTDNNTSCYCHRTISGQKRLSKHAQGLAVDINPLYNPCLHVKTGKVEPKAGTKFAKNRNRWAKDKNIKARIIDHQDPCYKLFIAHGFRWGGDWRSKKDWQHFEK